MPIIRSMIQPLSIAGVTSAVSTLRPLRKIVIAFGDLQNVVEEMRDEDDAAAALRAASRRTPNSRSISGGDKAEVGSSRMMMRAPENSTRESSTSCCTPIGKSPSRARGSMSSPRFLSCSRAAPRHAPPGDDADTVHRLDAEKDVLGDGEFRRDAKLLMHHADAGREGVARRAEMNFRPSTRMFAS